MVTCGANDGEASNTSMVLPSATNSPSAKMIIRVANSATNSTSWVAINTAAPEAARSFRNLVSKVLLY